MAFIRFYQEHQASFIFRIKDLDLVSVAHSYGLLRLPKMRELQGVDTSAFKTTSSIDISAIRYKDKQRNQQRKRTIEALKKLKTEGTKKADRAPILLDEDGGRAKIDKRGRNYTETRRTANSLDLGELKDDWKEYKKLKNQK